MPQRERLYYCCWSNGGTDFHLIVRAISKQAAQKHFVSWIVKRNPFLSGIIDYKSVKTLQPMYTIAKKRN